MNDFLVFYSEPGFPFWRILKTWSPFSPTQVAADFVGDFRRLVEQDQHKVGGGLATEVPRFIMVRGYCQN